MRCEHNTRRAEGQTLTVQWDRHCAVGETLTVQWDGHSLCSGTNIHCAMGQTITVQWDTHCALGQTLTVRCEHNTRRAETVVAGYSWNVLLVCVSGGAGRGGEGGQE